MRDVYEDAGTQEKTAHGGAVGVDGLLVCRAVVEEIWEGIGEIVDVDGFGRLVGSCVEVQ